MEKYRTIRASLTQTDRHVDVERSRERSDGRVECEKETCHVTRRDESNYYRIKHSQYVLQITKQGNLAKIKRART